MQKRKTKKKTPAKRTAKGWLGGKFPSYKKNLDMMKLLVSHKPFQEFITEAREFLDIPDDKSNEKRVGWGERLTERSEAILDSVDFQKSEREMDAEIERGRKIYYELSRDKSATAHDREKAQKNLDDAKTRREMLNFKIPSYYFYEMPRYIAARFNVPEHFSQFIQVYIWDDTVNAPTSNFQGGAWPPGKRSKDMRYVPINVYAQLTDEDFGELKRYLSFWGQRRLSKFNPIKDIDNKLTIETWIAEKPEGAYLDFAENDERGGNVRSTLTDLAKDAVHEKLMKGKPDGKRVAEAARLLEELRDKRFGKE